MGPLNFWNNVGFTIDNKAVAVAPKNPIKTKNLQLTQLNEGKINNDRFYFVSMLLLFNFIKLSDHIWEACEIIIKFNTSTERTLFHRFRVSPTIWPTITEVEHNIFLFNFMPKSPLRIGFRITIVIKFVIMNVFTETMMIS